MLKVSVQKSSDGFFLFFDAASNEAHYVTSAVEALMHAVGDENLYANEDSIIGVVEEATDDLQMYLNSIQKSHNAQIVFLPLAEMQAGANV